MRRRRRRHGSGHVLRGPGPFVSRSPSPTARAQGPGRSSSAPPGRVTSRCSAPSVGCAPGRCTATGSPSVTWRAWSASSELHAPATAATVRFAITGDADATRGPNGKPGFNGFETYRAMARARNDFNVNFGDTIYSDSEIGGAPIARTVAQKRAKYRLGLALAPLRQLRASAACTAVGTITSSSTTSRTRSTVPRSTAPARVRSSNTRPPRTRPEQVSIGARWGRNLELFLLDGRSPEAQRPQPSAVGHRADGAHGRAGARNARPGAGAPGPTGVPRLSPRRSGRCSARPSSMRSRRRSARRPRFSRWSSTPSR